jgi:hypothetical protein
MSDGVGNLLCNPHASDETKSKSLMFSVLMEDYFAGEVEPAPAAGFWNPENGNGLRHV